MSFLIEVDKTNEPKNGMMKKINVKGKDILLANVEGKYYAVDNRCPHLGGDLSKGKLDGTTIICPKHRSEFDLKDGHVIRWTDWSGIKLNLAKLFRSPKPLKTYFVKEGDGKIFLEIR